MLMQVTLIRQWVTKPKHVGKKASGEIRKDSEGEYNQNTL